MYLDEEDAVRHAARLQNNSPARVRFLLEERRVPTRLFGDCDLGYKSIAELIDQLNR
jgi:hypothetical protein